jgi:hypothetical protein
MRTWIIAIALALSLSTTTSCYGSFEMTRNLHQWNGQATDNKFVNWLLFVGLVIIPVYEISLLVDGFVFNSVEFWTGNNPARSGRLVLEQRDDGTIDVAIDGRAFEIRRAGSGLELYEAGVYQGRALRNDDGSLAFYDADGALMHTIEAPVMKHARAPASR